MKDICGSHDSLQVSLEPTPACLPCMRPRQVLDVFLRTTKATYSLARMLGHSALRCNDAWRQQEAETLAAVINHHLTAHRSSSQTVHVPSCKRLDSAVLMQNDLRHSAVSCMHRLGSCFDGGSTDQQHRLGAFAETMLQQQQAAIRGLNVEQGATWCNAWQADGPPLALSHANAQHLQFANRSERTVRIVFKRSISCALPLMLFAVALAGLLVFWLLIVADFLHGHDRHHRYYHHRHPSTDNFHFEILQELGEAWKDMMAAVSFVLLLGLDACALFMLLQDAVRISGTIENVGERVWSVRRVAKWTLRPRDGGIGCMQCWGAGQESWWHRKVAQGDISMLRGCEVWVPRAPCECSGCCIPMHERLRNELWRSPPSDSSDEVELVICSI